MNTAESYTSKSIADRIDQLRGQLGSRLVILGHHYQDHSITRHADILGDSLELARKVPEIDAEHIVFCGVFFMAESAALLARPGQTVHLPEMSANCVMAQMAPGPLVENITEKLSQTKKIIPLAYVNSSVEVKAIAGKYGGAVCTSANAERMLAWAYSQGDAVLFLPDKNLAWNTADILGIPVLERHMLSIGSGGNKLDLQAAEKARLLIWPGCCAIHARFNVRQVRSRRAEYPQLRVVVHPESSPEVVAASNAAGSTAFIIKYVENAPVGSTIAIGTEINLVERLQERHIHTHTIIPLLESECSHMDKTKPPQLLATLEAIAAGKAKESGPFNSSNRITVRQELVEDAKRTLDTMLRVCATPA